MSEALRERLWASATDDPWWWRDSAPLLPERVWDQAAERMCAAIDRARSAVDREGMEEGLLALYAAMGEAGRARWGPEIASRYALLGEGALPPELLAAVPREEQERHAQELSLRRALHRDALARDRLLRTLGWTLPSRILVPRREALVEALGSETAERMLDPARDPEIAPPATGEEAERCREAFLALLERPGWLSFEAGGWLAALAARLLGPEAGALLDDALQWGRATRR